MKSMDSADSDEEYVAEVEEVDEHSDELDSLVADDSEQDSSFEEDDEEEEEEEWCVIAKPRAQRLSTRSRKNSVKSEYDEEEEDEEEKEEDVDEGEEEQRSDVNLRGQKGFRSPRKRRQQKEVKEDEKQEDAGGGWITVVKPRVQMTSIRSRKNEVKSKKRRKVASIDSGESDDDDEEFTPDDFDSLEEDEDVSLPIAKTRKRKRTLKRKSSTNIQKRRGSSNAARKPLKKKTKQTRSLKRKSMSGDNEYVSDKRPVLRTRCKKRSMHRNRRAVDGLDSDFFSDASDYEFTLSEEEQVSKVDESMKTNLRRSRRTNEDKALCKPRKTVIRKGKEKAEETKNDVGKSICGICLTEEGKNTVRGTLNCCNHYFCFACIREWSNVESRCPVCKQRFVTISKPARNVIGFDLRNAIIQVPMRDQVYQPSEEEIREFLNPYESVICTECHEGGDDALMLLCDLCDSPAHTYCVGLGREVPVGNWYCDGCCGAVDFGSSHSQLQVMTPDRIPSTDASDAPFTYENMAEIDLNLTVPETPLSQGNGFLSSPRFSNGGFQASSAVSGIGVSTVSGRRRRIRSRIWNMLSDRLAPREYLNSTLGQNRTSDVGTSYYTQIVDRLHEHAPQNVENEDLFPRSMAQMDGLVVQSSTTTNGFDLNHTQLSGMSSRNVEAIQSQTWNDEQLRPCSSISGNLRACPSRDKGEVDANITRQQVNSMVRSELKILSRDVNMGHDAYADISRKCTDAVMAACGLESRRSNVYEARRPVCLHADKLDDMASCPISGCCFTCFQNFVKDVVRRIMNITVGPHWLLGH